MYKTLANILSKVLIELEISANVLLKHESDTPLTAAWVDLLSNISQNKIDFDSIEQLLLTAQLPDPVQSPNMHITSLIQSLPI